MITTDFTNIPSIDMKKHKTNFDQFQQALVAACENVGFFYLINHGIAADLTHAVLTNADLFFQSPQMEKHQISINKSPHYRGYGQLGAEYTEGISDYKETYDLGLEQPAHDDEQCSYLRLLGPNQWPAAPHFKAVMLKYINAMQQLSYQLLHTLISAIDPQSALMNQFDLASNDTYAMLRLLHYPPAKQPSLGVGPHTDAGCLILLLQDQVGGLEVQNHQQEWIAAPPKQDALIVNIGETLQSWSSGRFKATRHRVLNNPTQRRLSAPFFFEPNLATIVDPQNNMRYGDKLLQVFKRSFG